MEMAPSGSYKDHDNCPYVLANSCLFLVIISVRVNLRAPQLIFRDPEVNDQVSL